MREEEPAFKRPRSAGGERDVRARTPTGQALSLSLPGPAALQERLPGFLGEQLDRSLSNTASGHSPRSTSDAFPPPPTPPRFTPPESLHEFLPPSTPPSGDVTPIPADVAWPAFGGRPVSGGSYRPPSASSVGSYASAYSSGHHTVRRSGPLIGHRAPDFRRLPLTPQGSVSAGNLVADLPLAPPQDIEDPDAVSARVGPPRAPWADANALPFRTPPGSPGRAAFVPEELSAEQPASGTPSQKSPPVQPAQAWSTQEVTTQPSVSSVDKPTQPSVEKEKGSKGAAAKEKEKGPTAAAAGDGTGGKASTVKVSAVWLPVLAGRKNLKTTDVQQVCERFRELREKSGMSIDDPQLTVEHLATVLGPDAATAGPAAVSALHRLLGGSGSDGAWAETADFRLLLVAMAGLTKAKVPDRMRFAALLLDASGTGLLTREQLALIIHANHLLCAEAPLPREAFAENASKLCPLENLSHEEFLELVNKHPELVFPSVGGLKFGRLQSSSEAEAAEAAKRAEEERFATEAAEAAQKAEDERAAREAAEARQKVEEERAAREAAEAAREAADARQKVEEERRAREAAEARQQAEKEQSLREAASLAKEAGEELLRHAPEVPKKADQENGPTAAAAGDGTGGKASTVKVSAVWLPLLGGKKNLKTTDVQQYCERFRKLREESGMSIDDPYLSVEDLESVMGLAAASAGPAGVDALHRLLHSGLGESNADFRLLLVAMAGLTKAKVPDRMRFAALLLDTTNTERLSREQLALIIHANHLLCAEEALPREISVENASKLCPNESLTHEEFLKLVTECPELVFPSIGGLKFGRTSQQEKVSPVARPQLPVPELATWPSLPLPPQGAPPPPPAQIADDTPSRPGTANWIDTATPAISARSVFSLRSGGSSATGFGDLRQTALGGGSALNFAAVPPPPPPPPPSGPSPSASAAVAKVGPPALPPGRAPLPPPPGPSGKASSVPPPTPPVALASTSQADAFPLPTGHTQSHGELSSPLSKSRPSRPKLVPPPTPPSASHTTSQADLGAPAFPLPPHPSVAGSPSPKSELRKSGSMPPEHPKAESGPAVPETSEDESPEFPFLLGASEAMHLQDDDDLIPAGGLPPPPDEDPPPDQDRLHLTPQLRAPEAPVLPAGAMPSRDIRQAATLEPPPPPPQLGPAPSGNPWSQFATPPLSERSGGPLPPQVLPPRKKPRVPQLDLSRIPAKEKVVLQLDPAAYSATSSGTSSSSSRARSGSGSGRSGRSGSSGSPRSSRASDLESCPPPLSDRSRLTRRSEQSSGKFSESTEQDSLKADEDELDMSRWTYRRWQVYHLKKMMLDAVRCDPLQVEHRRFLLVASVLLALGVVTIHLNTAGIGYGISPGADSSVVHNVRTILAIFFCVASSLTICYCVSMRSTVGDPEPSPLLMTEEAQGIVIGRPGDEDKSSKPTSPSAAADLDFRGRDYKTLLEDTKKVLEMSEAAPQNLRKLATEWLKVDDAFDAAFPMKRSQRWLQTEGPEGDARPGRRLRAGRASSGATYDNGPRNLEQGQPGVNGKRAVRFR
eukprot:TRINITY_DN4104_c0_g1_i5.p1 TRINITY_DN4104_c0_g1~~TRINITY_DN4104_c0_g1_i5.p1  ORF type:complete len:1585 (+),score=359.66 TRINITY_DN4104_c0_g1_i5:124-4755(+)